MFITVDYSQQIEIAKSVMGKSWLLHPDNMVKRKKEKKKTTFQKHTSKMLQKRLSALVK